MIHTGCHTSEGAKLLLWSAYLLAVVDATTAALPLHEILRS